MMGRPSGCSVHRAALAAFVERSERGPATAAALDHLQRCRRCEADLSQMMLAIHAVRRLLEPARTTEPPSDAWDRLRRRIEARVPRAAGAWTSFGGLVVGAGLVAALIGPVASFRTTGAIEHEPGADPAIVNARTVADQLGEAAFQARIERAPRHVSVPAAVPTAAWRGPDGLGWSSPWAARTEAPSERTD